MSIDLAGTTPPVETETRFWIQEQAPSGNWVDSVGLHLECTEKEALKDIKGWKKSFPKRQTRLVRKTVTNEVLA